MRLQYIVQLHCEGVFISIDNNVVQYDCRDFMDQPLYVYLDIISSNFEHLNISKLIEFSVILKVLKAGGEMFNVHISIEYNRQFHFQQ